jgi:hypothetical protein
MLRGANGKCIVDIPRQICTDYEGKFMAAVTREIIIQMPLGDMRRKVNRDFVKTIMPYILARYINFPNSRPGFPIAGPNTIKRVVGNIARTAARGGFNVDTNALTLRVCRIVCGMCPTFWHRVLYPTRQHTAGWPDNNDEALVVAIGLKKKALIRLYLNAGATVWHKTPLFGHTWMRVAMYRGIGGIRYLTGFIRPATDSTRNTSTSSTSAHLQNPLPTTQLSSVRTIVAKVSLSSTTP